MSTGLHQFTQLHRFCLVHDMSACYGHVAGAQGFRVAGRVLPHDTVPTTCVRAQVGDCAIRDAGILVRGDQ